MGLLADEEGWTEKDYYWESPEDGCPRVPEQTRDVTHMLGYKQNAINNLVSQLGHEDSISAIVDVVRADGKLITCGIRGEQFTQETAEERNALLYGEVLPQLVRDQQAVIFGFHHGTVGLYDPDPGDVDRYETEKLSRDDPKVKEIIVVCATDGVEEGTIFAPLIRMEGAPLALGAWEQPDQVAEAGNLPSDRFAGVRKAIRELRAAS